eukprot:Clim_evm7s128 gene=Clim_evmTU7s128
MSAGGIGRFNVGNGAYRPGGSRRGHNSFDGISLLDDDDPYTKKNSSFRSVLHRAQTQLPKLRTRSWIILIVGSYLFYRLFLSGSSSSQRSPSAERYAYVTMITNYELEPVARVWARSLKQTGTQYDLVLMLSIDGMEGSKDADVIGKLQAQTTLLFDHFQVVPMVQNKYNVKGYAKINAWNLTQYDRVLWMDMDMIIIDNLDHLFVQHGDFAAAPDIYNGDTFNSGVMVLRPDTQTYKHMLGLIYVKPAYNKGDQGFLNSFFDDWYMLPSQHRLPFSYNTIVTLPSHYNAPSWYTSSEDLLKVVQPKVVHFANPWHKPWKEQEGDQQALNDEGGSDNDDSKGENKQLGKGSLFSGMWWDLWKQDQSNAVIDPEAFKIYRGRMSSVRPRLDFPRVGKDVPRPKEIVGKVFPRMAYVTYVLGIPDIVHAYALWQSLKMQDLADSYNEIDVIVLYDVTRISFTPAEEEHLSQLDWDLRPVKPSSGKQVSAELQLMVHCFSLVEYNKVAVVHPWALSVGGFGEIFHSKAPAMTPAVYPPDIGDGRVALIQPDGRLHEFLLSKIDYFAQWPLGSDDVMGNILNSVYPEWYAMSHKHRLPSGHAVDFWFKPGLAKYMEPWRILLYPYDEKNLDPTTSWQQADMWPDREAAKILWWRSLCRADRDTVIEALDHLSYDANLHLGCKWVAEQGQIIGIE